MGEPAVIENSSRLPTHHRSLRKGYRLHRHRGDELRTPENRSSLQRRTTSVRRCASCRIAAQPEAIAEEKFSFSCPQNPCPGFGCPSGKFQRRRPTRRAKQPRRLSLPKSSSPVRAQHLMTRPVNGRKPRRHNGFGGLSALKNHAVAG